LAVFDVKEVESLHACELHKWLAMHKKWCMHVVVILWMAGDME